MPILSNQRWERFAQTIASGKSTAEAMQSAGYAENPRNAWRLKNREAIRRRIEEILKKREAKVGQATEKAVEKLAITVEGLLGELEEARLMAVKLGQPSAAVAAVKEKSVLSGLRVERTEISGDFDGLSRDQLRLELLKAAQELGFGVDLAGLLEDGRVIEGEAVDGSDDGRPN